MGYVTPVTGFLEGLRERAARYGALLIFDEVITWLRFGLGGAQARVGIAPDLTTIGKIMGGGAPIAAFGGREDVMAVLAPLGGTFTGGTHGGNPFCVGMAHRVLDLLEAHPEYYDQMRGLAEHLADGIRAIFDERRLALRGRATRIDRRFQIPRGATESQLRRRACCRQAQYADYWHAMLDRGVLLPPSQNEVMFVSTAHTAEDIDGTLAAIEAAIGH